MKDTQVICRMKHAARVRVGLHGASGRSIWTSKLPARLLSTFMFRAAARLAFVFPVTLRPTIPFNTSVIMANMLRTSPNIIITGTPGVGKSTTAEQLAQKTGLKHVDINKVVKEHNCGSGYDDDLKTTIVDEDRLLDVLENDLEEGGNIIDWHACDLFPPSQIDLVAVIRCDNTILHDRLKARGYGDKKLEENMDAEIMQVLLQEARDAYEPEIVVELQSDKLEDVDSNVERLDTWVENWKKDHAEVKGQGNEEEEELDPDTGMPKMK